MGPSFITRIIERKASPAQLAAISPAKVTGTLVHDILNSMYCAWPT